MWRRRIGRLGCSAAAAAGGKRGAAVRLGGRGTVGRVSAVMSGLDRAVEALGGR